MRGQYFSYDLDEYPNEVFSDDFFLIFSIHCCCYCYENTDLDGTYMNAYVVRKDKPLTFRDVFLQIDKQLGPFICNHRFLEGFDKIGSNCYEICCGS